MKRSVGDGEESKDDLKTAASDILQYLERENIIAKSEPVQIEYSDASKAA